jgi:predicted aspartyl protease
MRYDTDARRHGCIVIFHHYTRAAGSALALPVLGLLLLSACVRVGGSRPQIQLSAADEEPSAVAHPAPDLAAALRSLDTLFVPTTTPAATERALLEGVRLIRRGQLSAAARVLQPLASEDTLSRFAQDIRGHLLVHESRWSEVQQLVPATDSRAVIARAFRDALPEAIDFSADTVVLPLLRSRAGTPVVEAIVGGVPRRFWIDTGAGLTVLSATLASELGLTQAPLASMTVNTGTTRTVRAQPVVVPEIRLGDGFRVRHHPALVLQDRDLEFRVAGIRLLKIQGIIGWNLIRQLDLTLDPARGVAVLRRPRAEERGARNLLWLGVPIAVAQSEAGAELLFGLDTGAAASSLAPRFLETAEAGPARTRTRRIGSAGGFEKVIVQTVPSATVLVAGQRVHFSRIDVRSQPVSRPASLHGMIGSDLARAAVLRIDWLNGRFELEAGSE